MGASRDKLRAHRQQDLFALCYADQAVRRATEAIPTFFANLRAHVPSVVHTADFNELSEAEKRHFYKCSRCREMVDKRQLDEVLFHEDHLKRPDIQYAGSERIEE
jgi:hypothetical protein